MEKLRNAQNKVKMCALQICRQFNLAADPVAVFVKFECKETKHKKKNMN